MERIIIIIFLFILLPYVGLPSNYDTPIVIFLIVALVWAMWTFVQSLKKESDKRVVTKQTSPKKQKETKLKSAKKQKSSETELLSQADKDSIKAAVKKTKK